MKSFLIVALAPLFVQASEIESIAKQALDQSLIVSTSLEVGGIIMDCGGEIKASSPFLSGSERKISYTISFPKSCTLIGLYHTHPGDVVRASRISAQDVSVALQLNVPTYVRVVKSGKTCVFDPSVDSAHYDRTRMHEGMTADCREI